MGIRETLNENRAVSIGATIGITVLALIWIVSQFWTSAPPVPKAWFTTDDGKDYFAADATNIPPFKHDGKDAYQVFVFKCGADGKPWVSHLMRYTEQGRKTRQQQISNKVYETIELEINDQIEVKDPGSAEWVKGNDRRAMEIKKREGPNRCKMNIIEVFPN